MVSFLKYLVNKASRDTSSGQFIPEIDGLRFIAIFSVFLFHLSGYVANKTGRIQDGDPLAALLSYGHVGVPLFFVISGFVIALPFAKGHFGGGKLPRLRQYFTRRLSRLEPPYIVNLIFLFLLIPLVTPGSLLNLLPNLFASMAYMHNVIFGVSSSINCVAWSLEVELQFYVLAPFIANLFKIKSKAIRRGTILLLISLFTIVRNSLGENISPIYELSILSQAQFFLTGFLLLDIYLSEWDQKPQKEYIWDILSVLSWFSIIALMLMKHPAFTVIPIFFAYCAAFKGTMSNRFFCQPIIYVIGGMCYTIYLYHYTLISAFGRLLIRSGILNHFPVWTGILIATALLAPVTLLLCTILFIYIEKPCMKRDWHLSVFNKIKSRVSTPIRPAVKLLDD